MKIGFFGDSYLDLSHNNISRDNRPWSTRLVEDFDLNCVSSGLGGTSQYYAIHTWKKFIEKKETLDFAFFSFTWHDRLYNRHEVNQEILRNMAEMRDVADIIEQIDRWDGVPKNYPSGVKLAAELYYNYLYSEDLSMFNYQLQLEYILNLPKKYPETNFIFIPNTEYSRQLATSLFSHGCLINFAFETLSNIEVGSPGAMPINCNRVGHINNSNHELLKEEFYHIITNYETYKDSIYNFDYNKFDICK